MEGISSPSPSSRIASFGGEFEVEGGEFRRTGGGDADLVFVSSSSGNVRCTGGEKERLSSDFDIGGLDASGDGRLCFFERSFSVSRSSAVTICCGFN